MVYISSRSNHENQSGVLIATDSTRRFFYMLAAFKTGVGAMLNSQNHWEKTNGCCTRYHSEVMILARPATIFKSHSILQTERTDSTTRRSELHFSGWTNLCP